MSDGRTDGNLDETPVPTFRSNLIRDCLVFQRCKVGSGLTCLVFVIGFHNKIANFRSGTRANFLEMTDHKNAENNEIRIWLFRITRFLFTSIN